MTEKKTAVVEDKVSDAKQAAEEAKKQIADFEAVSKELMPPEALQVAADAKAQNVEVFGVQIVGDYFVYRPLSRLEYQSMLLEQTRQAQALLEQADSEIAGRLMSEMKGQEDIVLKATMYPRITKMSIKEMNAGTVETLHNSIMMVSGFGQEPMPFKL